MLIAIFITIFNILNLYAKSVNFNNEPICVTKICNNTALRIQGLMNLDIDPCTDFYQYACGNWPKNANNSVFSSLQKEINHKLAEIVNTVPSSERKTPLAKTKMFYESCIDTDKIESEGVSDLLKIIDKNGGWPMIMSENDWRSKKKSWQEVDIAYRKITNHSPIFSLNVVDLMRETSLPFILLNSPFKDYNEYFLSRNISELNIFMVSLKVINYMNVLKNISQIIAKYRSYSLSEEILEDDVNNIVKFEWELGQIVKNLTKNSPGDDNKQILSIDDFQKNYSLVCCETKNSKIDWLYMINQHFDDVSNIHVNGSEEIMVKLNYFLQLSDLLDRTPSRVIVNTIHWNFIKILGPHTSKEMIILFKKLLSIPTNPFSLTTRHEACIEIVRINMPHALAYSYIKKFFSKETKNLNENLVSEIASVMEFLLKNSSRIRNHMKQELSTKIRNLKQFIAYPNWYENETEVNHFYDDIIMSDSYFDNIISIKKFKFILELKSFRDCSIRKKIWTTPPTHVNAYYLPWINSITLPAGIIQRPYFDHQQLDVLNYGGIGTTIGHELAHMIDIFENSFIYKDNDIKSRSVDTIKHEFSENIECILFEFSNYTLELNNRTYKVNPFRTLEENFADTVGIQVAYEAFQTHMIKEKKTKIRLPGFEHLGSNQLFFLSYAQTECGSQCYEKLIEDFNDFHSPAMFRVIGSLSNNEHFAEAFQCAKGTKMNPTNKCSFL